MSWGTTDRDDFAADKSPTLERIEDLRDRDRSAASRPFSILIDEVQETNPAGSWKTQEDFTVYVPDWSWADLYLNVALQLKTDASNTQVRLVGGLFGFTNALPAGTAVDVSGASYAWYTPKLEMRDINIRQWHEQEIGAGKDWTVSLITPSSPDPISGSTYWDGVRGWWTKIQIQVIGDGTDDVWVKAEDAINAWWSRT